MVDRALRPPRGEGGDAIRRWLQASAAIQPLHFRLIRVAVEVAHQHRVGVVSQQFGDEVDLRLARPAAQRQMRHRHGQRVIAIAESADQHATALDPAGQRMLFDPFGFQLAQQAVGAGGDAAHPAVGLVAPVGEATALRQIVGLVGEAGAQAARIRLLQADDVVAAREFGDQIQRAALVAGRQYVRPAAGHVVLVAAGARTRLDIGAQQAQPARLHQAAGSGVVRPAARRRPALRWEPPGLPHPRLRARRRPSSRARRRPAG